MTNKTKTGSLKSFMMGILLTITSLSLMGNYAFYSGRIALYSSEVETVHHETTSNKKKIASVFDAIGSQGE